MTFRGTLGGRFHYSCSSSLTILSNPRENNRFSMTDVARNSDTYIQFLLEQEPSELRWQKETTVVARRRPWTGTVSKIGDTTVAGSRAAEHTENDEAAARGGETGGG